MGVSTQDLVIPHARPLERDVVLEYDCSNLPCVWRVTRRDPADRGSFLIRRVMRLFSVLGFPSTGWYHDQGTFSTEEKARAYVNAFDDDGKWDIYPQPIDEGMPLERVRPRYLYSPKAYGQSVRSNYAVIERAILDDAQVKLRQLIQTLRGG